MAPPVRLKEIERRRSAAQDDGRRGQGDIRSSCARAALTRIRCAMMMSLALVARERLFAGSDRLILATRASSCV